ncbi:AMP-binding protein [Halalkalibacterium ligniniphilum]|uniref:AMP-binding protein n=1 Tax=Halalkalibacterium ligniniphilum TaxID=1134413 RepID=UPI000688AE61|nr:AMP-binding protein [Halalkalibacterium ligniniphilum]
MEATRLYQWMKKLGFTSYEAFYQASIDDIAWFWEEAEKELGIPWFKQYEKALSLEKGIQWPVWFQNGALNAMDAAVSRWANDPTMREKQALLWEGEDGQIRQYSFAEMQAEVERAAGGLKKLGLKKGEIVAIYMPMLPETVIAMMAISKLGAIYSPVFSGYGAEAVATRLQASEAKMLLTADGFYRRGKPIDLRREAEKAVALSPTVEQVIVVGRLEQQLALNHHAINWNELIQAEPMIKTEEMESDETLMLIYTSGTTGRPKGAVHTHSGFPIKAAFDAGIGMDVKKEDVMFWYTDMGWMMGPFLVYGGLINGATILLYEGTPDYPHPDRLWKIVSDHGVTHLGVSPTLIRGMMKHGEKWAKPYDLSTLRVIGSTGEPWNPEPWRWLFEKIGHGKIPIFNYSGGTEISGGILGNVLIRPIGPITFNSPLPGMAADVYSQDGKSISNEVGELVLTKPWVGMTNGFWKEHERFHETYWSRWPNTWVHGDWVIKDEEGFWTITGRSDDTLNIAGKRVGPAEVESVLVSDHSVVEAGTIGVPDPIKGEVAICFVVLAPDISESAALKERLLNLVAEKLGKALKPKDIFFVQDLPKTRNAKVMRRAIKAAYLHQSAGDLSSLENPEAVEEIQALRKSCS